jgi:hypothetical protein
MFTENIIHKYILQEINEDKCNLLSDNQIATNNLVIKPFFPKSITINEILKKEIHIKLPIKETKIKKRFVPRKNDTLFWIFYIIMNGFAEYELIGTNDFEIEQTEKYKYIDFLRKEDCKQLLKQYKITKIKEDIENELGHTSRISHKTFFALCVCYKLNIIFIYRKRCFQIYCGKPEDPIHVVHQYDPPIENPHGRFKYAYEIDPLVEKYKSNEYFHWENIDKPLRCISYYKVKDLLDICILLKLKEEDYKQLNKPELYELILRVI